MTARDGRPRPRAGRTVLLASAVLALLLLSGVRVMAGALTLSMNLNPAGAWNAGTFAQAQLTGTGTDFIAAGTPVTVADKARMRVTNAAGVNWAISVSRTGGATWNDSLVLSAILSTQGNAPVTSPVGTTVALDTNSQQFITGTGNCGVTTRFRVSYSLVVTVTAGPAAYSTTVTYTVAQI